MVPFSRRELTKAWKCARTVATIDIRSDAHRLLLFYSVECGLKAIQLRQLNLDIADERIAREHSHDINSLLIQLRMGKEYLLPLGMQLQPLKDANGAAIVRSFAMGSLNQVWRYGGALTVAENLQLEKALEKINTWIAKEIR